MKATQNDKELDPLRIQDLDKVYSELHSAYFARIRKLSLLPTKWIAFRTHEFASKDEELKGVLLTNEFLDKDYDELWSVNKDLGKVNKQLKSKKANHESALTQT